MSESFFRSFNWVFQRGAHGYTSLVGLALRGSTLVLVEKCGHMSTMERPDEVSRAMREWLTQRPDSGVWAGLWSLPEFASAEAFEAHRQGWPGEGESLASFTHVLTHLDWRLHPLRWTLPQRMGEARVKQVTDSLPAGRWFERDEALSAGLPAPLRRLLSS